MSSIEGVDEVGREGSSLCSRVNLSRNRGVDDEDGLERGSDL